MLFNRKVLALSLIVTACASLSFSYHARALSTDKPESAQGEKPRSGWLYIVDSRGGKPEGQVLLVDPSAGGRVVRVFKTGMNPDIALSPSGTRLYVASSQMTTEGTINEELSVVDTSTGATLQTIGNAKRVTYNVVPPSTALAISPNGHWLYVMKYEVVSSLNTLYWIETFDTVSGKFLPGKADISGCGWGRLLPSEKNREVQVACEQSKDVRLLKVDQRGTAVASAAQFAPRNSSAAPSVSFERRAGKINANLVADSFGSSNGRTVTVLKDGRILSYDPATNALAEVASAELPADAWIQTIAKAKGNNWLYLGLKASPTTIEGKWEGEIVSLNVSNFSPGRSNKTSQRFSYLHVSRNGQWLYAVNTQDANILIIEASTLKEVSAITDLGETPSLIVESP